jgi:hypothetical protein
MMMAEPKHELRYRQLARECVSCAAQQQEEEEEEGAKNCACPLAPKPHGVNRQRKEQDECDPRFLDCYDVNSDQIAHLTTPKG